MDKLKILVQLQGGNSWEIWLAGIVWSLVGIALVKTYYFNNHNKFSLRFWINDNLKDVALGLLICLIILRMGNLSIRMFERAFSWEIGEVEDFVAFMIFISIFVQDRLHKKRKPISENVADRMEACNRLHKQENE